MAAPTWIFLTTLVALTSLSLATDSDGGSYDSIDFIFHPPSQRDKREIDSVFLRRYDHLRRQFSHNPFAFAFLKYFLRNRGQRRERRQVDNYYNNGGFSNAYTRYNENRRVAQRPTTQRPKQVKRQTTRRRKPFKPGMVFF